MYRAVTLNNLRVTHQDAQPRVSGLAVNTGTETATIVRIIALLFDVSGQPIWADAGFVETNIYPGQSAPFSFVLPVRNDITVIEPVEKHAIAMNGSTQQTDTGLPDSMIGTIILPDVPGYSAVRLHVSTMTHDPLF